MTQYYIDISGTKDGPHDLVTIMRRIRAQQISPDTAIYTDEAPTPVPASQHPDIALFFGRDQVAETANPIPVEIPALRLMNLLHEGWRFTSENSIMTVFAGSMLLLTILLATGMATAFGPMLGGMVSWLIFMMFHFVYLVCCLRLYRGQPLSRTFWNQQLRPRLNMILFAGIVAALMMIGGFLLLVIPGFIVAVYYAFVPFFILDRHMSLIEAMHASRLLVVKHNGRYQTTVAMLILMHGGSLLLIVPMPLSLPILAASLARMYEELSTS